MATAADYVGKNCPYCGAIDSIDTDEVRGEAACTNCATVIAMGLEENVATRWEKEATFADVDQQEDWTEHGRGAAPGGVAKGSGLTREEAAAAAAGKLRRPSSSSAEFFDASRYAKTRLHPRQSLALETLFRLSRRTDDAILQEAVELAKYFVGRRRERSIRVEHHQEVAAACLMLAAEHHGCPIPLSEMRVLDPSLKDVETRRHEIIAEANLTAEVAKYERKTVENLIHYYLQLLQLQLIRYERPCLALFQAIVQCERTADPAAAELAQLVEAEKVVAAVLLAYTASSLRWSNKPPPPSETSDAPPAQTLYSSFASSAHLPLPRVLKIMRVAEKALPLVHGAFEAIMAQPVAVGGTVPVRPTGEAVKKEGERETVGVKRRRSRSATPPAPPAERERIGEGAL